MVMHAVGEFGRLWEKVRNWWLEQLGSRKGSGDSGEVVWLGYRSG